MDDGGYGPTMSGSGREQPALAENRGREAGSDLGMLGRPGRFSHSAGPSPRLLFTSLAWVRAETRA